jgi:hypothetical protein
LQKSIFCNPVIARRCVSEASVSKAVQSNKQGLDCFRLRQKATADMLSQEFLAMTLLGSDARLHPRDAMRPSFRPIS